jgi:Flp pilus assembly protein TadD
MKYRLRGNCVRLVMAGLISCLVGCQSARTTPQVVTNDMRTRLSRALAESGDEVNAAEALRTPASREAEAAPETLENASILIAAGQVDKGMALAKTALAARGNAPEFALEVASLALKANRFSDADQIYNRILQSDPRNIDALNGRGVALAQLGNLAASVVSLQSALAISPQDVAARSNLALVLLLEGQNETALSLLEELERTNPSSQIEATLTAARQRVESVRIAHATEAGPDIAAASIAAALPSPSALPAPVDASPSVPPPVAATSSNMIVATAPPSADTPLTGGTTPSGGTTLPKITSESSAWSCPAACKLLKLLVQRKNATATVNPQ